ncbi:hypothetical protein EHM94_17825 [Marinobacter sp. NP-6]|uniref:hypothetical protein n=1 Tax=Marinobacter sp. NP-6 TaxID=2488666 RepID=UPI000FCC2D70|nr:hypothetical protein [Marinobacter sp. NP-6]RUT76893.1 hypothetical protein EHM94_17825 [Marinobacter sp. NP-6]
MERNNLKYRRVRARSIVIAPGLSVGLKNLLADRRYRIRDLCRVPTEKIVQYVELHPPVVLKHGRVFHAIANLRSVDLLAYLDHKEKVSVLVHEEIPREQLAEMVVAWEFGKLAFDAFDPSNFAQTALALWLQLQKRDSCPSFIRTKQKLARFLSVNRRKFSVREGLPPLESKFSGQGDA